MTSPVTQSFATPIYYQIHEDVEELNSRLTSSIRDLAKHNKSNDDFRAHHGGFYSKDPFFSSSADGAAEVGALIRKSFLFYLYSLNINVKKSIDTIRFESWVGLTRSGDYQTPHVHRGAAVSGVYYVKVPDCPKPQGCIDFISPLNSQEMSFLLDVSHSHVSVSPKAGSVVIFPYYLRHFTHPFEGDEDRICVVFNAIVSHHKRVR